MPVRITSTAVSDGNPPSCSVMPMATGAVTDFGASDRSVSRLAPSSQPSPVAVPMAVSEPQSRLVTSASAERLTRSNCR